MVMPVIFRPYSGASGYVNGEMSGARGALKPHRVERSMASKVVSST